MHRNNMKLKYSNFTAKESQGKYKELVERRKNSTKP